MHIEQIPFPGEALDIIIGKVRGKDVAIAELLYAGGRLLEYAAGQMEEDFRVSLDLPAAMAINPAHEVEILEFARVNGNPNSMQALGVIPWEMIIRIVIKILAEKLS